MEELQDAIEDAQYVNAIATQDVRPVLPWEIPSEEQLAEWETKVRGVTENDPSGRLGEPLSFDWYMSSAIGFFLFSAFLKENKNDYLRINFVEEVLRFKKLTGKQRLEKVRTILSEYLKVPKKTLDTGEPDLPAKKEIDEFDLDRKPPELNLVDGQFQDLCSKTLDPENTYCCIGLKGPVRDELITKIQENLAKAEAIQKAESVPSLCASADAASDAGSPSKSEHLTKSTTSNSSESVRNLTKRMRGDAGDIPPDLFDTELFDQAEAIVMEGLRKEHWDDFTESEWYKKMRNFFWYQDRRVVPEDFFVMRVLGRGGFGLVTGAYTVRLLSFVCVR
jgi:hypothetical protein